MYKGHVVSINITPEESKPMHSVPEIQAIQSRGLVGDRYYYSGSIEAPDRKKDQQVTLIEAEAVDALQHESNIHLQPGDIRRNLVTRDVPLNHLVGKEFQVGEVRLRGIRLCEPCNHLASLTHPGVLPGLVHRAGLRAEILTSGTIRAGDVIESR